MKTFFVSGTGTGVGKTYVACALIRALRAQGKRVAALKPVASGVEPGKEEESDAAQILDALGVVPTPENFARVTPFAFRAALSPDMAAHREGRKLAIAGVLAACRAPQDADVLLIEGAGGIMSPIARGHLNIELAAALGAPVVLVAGTYLGTISHILTAFSAFKLHKVVPCALVLSESLNGPVAPEEIRDLLKQYVAGLTIVALPRGGGLDPAILGQ